MKKLIILQTVIPDYRKNLFVYIKDKLEDSFELYGGGCYFEKSVKSDLSIMFKKPVKNYFLFGRRFLFQTGMWDKVPQKNIIILEMNPRIISNWLILLIRKTFFRKTILWGHAWPRSGANSKSDRLRNMMRILGDEIVVYTKTQQQELRLKMPNKKIKVAPNAVFYKNEMIANQDIDQIKNIIYVGRLTKDKKPLFLANAFHQVLEELPKEVNLLIVGNGEERKSIEDYVKQNGLSERIKLLGHIGDYDMLKALYASSLVSISPGYIGLSVTQSFGFGVPMVISKNEPHSPEIEAVIEGENALFFETDEMKSLTDQILNIYQFKERWINKRTTICEGCKKQYSIDTMGDTFIKLLNEK